MNNSNIQKCPECNCPQTQCPPQITMEDIIKATMPQKIPTDTFGEFHLNSSDTSISATDRWLHDSKSKTQPMPYNPSAQGIMPYSNAIKDNYKPIKLDTIDDIFNLEESINDRINVMILNQIR